MHVPFGWAALIAGVCGAIMYTSRVLLSKDPEFALLAASLAAFVAGWVACISIPRLERRIDGADRPASHVPRRSDHD
jgi:hypothetical protein